MLVELKPVNAQVALDNAKAINLFVYSLSNILQSYQEKEVNSFIPTKPDHYGQPNKIIQNQKLKNIPGSLGIKTILPIEPIISNLPNIR